MKTMAAGSFKARCLAVMDEVQAKRETVLSLSAASRWRSSCPQAKTQTRFTASSAARARLQATSSRLRSKTGATSSDPR